MVTYNHIRTVVMRIYVIQQQVIWRGRASIAASISEKISSLENHARRQQQAKAAKKQAAASGRQPAIERTERHQVRVFQC
jgi:hypothetical protein